MRNLIDSLENFLWPWHVSRHSLQFISGVRFISLKTCMITLKWMFTDALKLSYNQGLLSLFTEHNRKEKRLICPKCHVIEGKKFAVRYDSQTLIASHWNNLWQVCLVDLEWIFLWSRGYWSALLSQTVFVCFFTDWQTHYWRLLKGPGRQKKYRPGSRKMGLWSMAFLEINLKRKEFCFFLFVVSHPGERSVSIFV